MEQDDLLRRTSMIVGAYVGGNPTPASDLPALIKSVHGALSGLADDNSSEPTRTPVVPIKRSITPDYIICLEDGKKLKMLKRYLRTRYKLTPEQYRTKWRLPSNYPMVAPNYSRTRSEFAKRIGLGKSPPGRRRRRGQRR